MFQPTLGGGLMEGEGGLFKETLLLAILAEDALDFSDILQSTNFRRILQSDDQNDDNTVLSCGC